MQTLIVGAGFIVLSILFAAFAVFYLGKNNFAKETLDVVFPASGAMLFSLYLGFKAVCLDAPNPEHFGGPVAVLIHAESGTIHGVPFPSLDLLPSLDEFRGAHLIDTIPDYDAFKPIDIGAQLRRDQPGLAPEFIAHIIEYAILSWLNNPDLLPGATDQRSTKLISGSGGSVAMPRDLVSVSASNEGLKSNPLLATEPIALWLPRGAGISRIEPKPFGVRLQTPHSALTIRLRGWNCESLLGAITHEAKLLYTALHFPSQSGMTLCAYDVDFEFSQRVYSRFSLQAKKEARWAARIREQFTRDFSWEHVKQRILGTAK